MTDWYNLTSINATGLVPLMQTINDNLVFGQLGHVLLFVLFIIILVSTTIYNNNPKINVMVSFFATWIISMFFIIFKLIQPFVVFLLFGGFVVSAMVALWMRN